MSTCFIADLHLSEKHPEITQRFLHFLKQEASKHQTLYILGDLFEVWLGDDLSSEEAHPILQALHDTAQQGTTIYVQHGNRDFLLGTAFEKQSGCKLIPDPYRIELNNTPVLLTHGDQLCSDDESYQRYRSIIQHPITRWSLLHLPHFFRRKIGQQLRQQSNLGKLEKSSYTMDVTTHTVESWMRKHKVSHLIHGHTHRPAAHTLSVDGGAAQRMVLGDWDSGNSMLIYDSGEFTLQSA
jgi:UDP-2,3-diacylglucosamine hydrolase